MSQKSSIPQAATSVSQVLTADIQGEIERAILAVAQAR